MPLHDDGLSVMGRVLMSERGAFGGKKFELHLSVMVTHNGIRIAAACKRRKKRSKVKGKRLIGNEINNVL
jgi:hypothetical protein